MEELEKKSNLGFLYSPPRPSDFIFGGASNKEVLQENRDWTLFLPEFESQAFKYFDPFACVSYSALNCLEIELKRKYNYSINFSDRFTAKDSNTGPLGNFFVNVADSIRKNGVVLERVYPAPFEIQSRAEYYQELTDDLRVEAKKALKDYDITYEWVATDSDTLWEALKYAPIQVGWFYGKVGSDGIYPRYSDVGNHAVTLIGGEYGKEWLIFDSYPAQKIKRLAWDSLFWGALRYNISKSNPNTIPVMPKFDEGKMYQLVEGRGGAFLFSRNQMLTGDEAKVLFAWTVMNNGDTKDKVGRLLLNDVKSLQLYDMGRKLIPNTYV